MSKKFPNLIHVSIEEEGSKDEFLAVSTSGVDGHAVAGIAKPCAIYKLVQVGKVVAPPAFIANKRAPR